MRQHRTARTHREMTISSKMIYSEEYINAIPGFLPHSEIIYSVGLMKVSVTLSWLTALLLHNSHLKSNRDIRLFITVYTPVKTAPLL